VTSNDATTKDVTIQDQVIEIIAEQALLSPDEINLTDTPADLGVDSMGLVESIFAIEETFDVTVPFNANAPQESDFDISSVAAIVKAVEGLRLGMMCPQHCRPCKTGFAALARWTYAMWIGCKFKLVRRCRAMMPTSSSVASSSRFMTGTRSFRGCVGYVRRWLDHARRQLPRGLCGRQKPCASVCCAQVDE